YIAGERVALGALRVELAPAYARWLADPDVRLGLTMLGLPVDPVETEWVQDAIRASAAEPPARAHFTIYDRRDMTPVGTTGLSTIDYAQRQATFGILLGERRGEGLGTEATRLTLDWAFHVLGLENVLLTVKPWNVAGRRAYEKAGFREIGVRRRSLSFRGRRVDEVYMDAVPAD